jgi:hypothetical protein
MRLGALSCLVASGQIAAHRIDTIERAAIDVAPFQRVVWIAPPLLQRSGLRRMTAAASNAQAGARIGNLRIFGMGDTIERKDAIASVIYPASLLYFVSGVLEDNRDEPLAGMQRYYSAPYIGGGFEDVAFVKGQTTLSRPNAYAWSEVSGHDGANCDMTSHGGWAKAPTTLASIKFLIQKGNSDAW